MRKPITILALIALSTLLACNTASHKQNSRENTSSSASAKAGIEADDVIVPGTGLLVYRTGVYLYKTPEMKIAKDISNASFGLLEKESNRLARSLKIVMKNKVIGRGIIGTTLAWLAYLGVKNYKESIDSSAGKSFRLLFPFNFTDNAGKEHNVIVEIVGENECSETFKIYDRNDPANYYIVKWNRPSALKKNKQWCWCIVDGRYNNLMGAMLHKLDECLKNLGYGSAGILAERV